MRAIKHRLSLALLYIAHITPATSLLVGLLARKQALRPAGTANPRRDTFDERGSSGHSERNKRAAAEPAALHAARQRYRGHGTVHHTLTALQRRLAHDAPTPVTFVDESSDAPRWANNILRAPLLGVRSLRRRSVAVCVHDPDAVLVLLA